MSLWPQLGLLVVVSLASYLLGSIPSGLLLSRLAGVGDIRQHGSGNVGATNVFRAGGARLGAFTLVMDLGKGTLAAALGYQLSLEAGWIAGLSAILGHNFSCFLGFRAGKGVATSLGVLIVLSWPIALVAAAIWITVALVWRYSSLASLLALGSTPVWAYLLPANLQLSQICGTLLVAGLTCFSHRSNIRRLWHGQEFRLGPHRED